MYIRIREYYKSKTWATIHIHTTQFEEVLLAVQARWGKNARQPLSKIDPNTVFIPTGFPALDTTLPAGGIPKHRLTSVLGQGLVLAASALRRAKAFELRA